MQVCECGHYEFLTGAEVRRQEKEQLAKWQKKVAAEQVGKQQHSANLRSHCTLLKISSSLVQTYAVTALCCAQ